MPSSLRSRLALFALLGAFLIPIGMSSLRGLTHVLTCDEQVKQPFELIILPEGDPIVTSSTRLQRGQEAGLCGGLEVNMQARIRGENEIAMIVPIKNNSDELWRGTVKLSLGRTSIPVGIGEIEAGATEQDTLEFDLEEGTHQLNGSLLIGP